MAFATWQVNVSHTGALAQDQNTKTALKVKDKGKM